MRYSRLPKGNVQHERHGIQERRIRPRGEVFRRHLVFVAPIITIIALVAIGLNEALWEFFDVLPANSEQHILYPLAVYGCIAGMAAWSWIIAFSGSPKLRVGGTIAMLMLAAYGYVVVAPAAMPDFAASKWIAWVTGACAFGWLVQLRVEKGRIEGDSS